MKLIAVLLPFLLTGCLATAPVVPKWPNVPKEILESCPDLKTVDATNEKISVILESVTDNYSQYYDCKSKVNDWIEWYNINKKLWNEVK
jgi:hypothetical protein